MQPFGLALLAYHHGDEQAQVIVRRDDGHTGPMPIAHFFRPPDAFSPIEKMALELCRGHVLDVGAGAGVHSLYLQEHGQRVSAIDVSPHAVAVMQASGVTDVTCIDVFSDLGRTFDSVLMLGHGIGMVETIPGLDQFLKLAQRLLSPDGQIILDSLDVRQTKEPIHLAYQEANQQAGRYLGEIRLQFEYQGLAGPYCGWLHVDSGTLALRAGTAGWDCTVLQQEDNGDYLARLKRSKTGKSHK